MMSESHGGFARGLACGLPMSLALWGLVAWLVVVWL